MARHRFTKAEQRRGGKTTAALAGGTCSRCGKTFTRRLAYVGHLGLHVFADRYTGGNMKKAAEHFALLGQAATDPIPENGAWRKAHDFAAHVAEQRQRREELPF